MAKHQLFYGSDFLLFDAITKKPRTTRELSHLLQISEPIVAARLKRFAGSVPPLVVKRWPDRKWVPSVILRVESPRETIEAETGKPVVLPPVSKAVEPQVVGGRVVNVEETPAVPVEEAVHALPSSTREAPDPKPYVPPVASDVSVPARRLAEKMRVPAKLMEYGEVRLGKIGKCVKSCGRTSVLLYGGTNVCPICARGGR